MSIFQEEEMNENQIQFGISSQNKEKSSIFELSEDQKNNINKRLPRGFFLVRKQEYDKLGYMKKPIMEDIVYEPVKVQRQINFNNMIVQSINEAWSKKQQEMRKSNKFGLQYTMEGRSRQSQKIKNIIQRFRKLIKNSSVQNFLNKLGYMMALNEIEIQNKKGLLTIDTFKARYMVVLETAKSQLFETEVINQTDEMIEQFLCFVEQARKAQFENNIQSIQKSIDKITRYLSETSDNKTQSSWYFKKKKKADRNENYTEKQMLYIGELIKKLPLAYLVGVWQIINERSFVQCQRRIQSINLAEIGNKKLRDIEAYVKTKLSQLYRSRLKKKEKLLMMRKSQKIQLEKVGASKREYGNQIKVQMGEQIKLNPQQINMEQQIIKEQKQKYIDDINDIFDQDQQFQVKKEGNKIKEEYLEDFMDEEYENLYGQRFQDDKNQGMIQKKQMEKQDDIQRDEEDEYEEQISMLDESDSSIITDEDDSDF